MTVLLLLAAAVAAGPGPAAGMRLRAQLGRAASRPATGMTSRSASAPASRTTSSRASDTAVRPGAAEHLAQRMRRALRDLASDPSALRPLPFAAAGLIWVAGPLQAAAVGVLLAVAVDLAVARAERTREHGRLAEWERACEMVVSELRAGAVAATAFESAAGRVAMSRGRVDGGGVAEILREASGVALLGGDGPAVLRRSGDPRAGELGGAWRLATRHGIPLVDVIDRVRASVGERRERASRVDASLAGPRATAAILTALPAVGMVMGTGIGANPVGFLARGTIGGALALTGACLLAAGLVWTSRILAKAAR